MKQIKCIVTGAAGFIGSHVVDILVSHGYKVYAVDNLSTGKRENVNPKADFIKADIVDPKTWEELPVAEYVFHLAALARIQPSIEDPITSNDANVNGTLQVIEYCRKTGAKLIFSGSSSIYEGEKLPIKESGKVGPKSPYALQKYICEQYIDMYHKLYGVDFAILRYFNVYGERQILEGAYAAVVGIFLQQAQEGKPLTITNDGEQRRDFTYVRDVAIANMLAMSWRGTFNIGSGKNYSINDLAHAVGGEKQYIGNREGEARNTLADNSKACRNGWMPTMDILDWVRYQKEAVYESSS